jgi:hypothetical protein
VYISSLMLMALYEDRVRDHLALRARSGFGAASADAAAAGVRL